MIVGHVGLFGATASGKSTQARALLRDCPRLVIFDTAREHAGAVHELRQVKARLVRSWGRSYRIVYRPRAGDEPEALSRLSYMLRDCQEAARGARLAAPPIVLWAEELSIAYPNEKPARGLHGFSELCSFGRHFGIYIVGCSQRPAEVFPRFTGNLASTYVFRVNGAPDLARVERMLPAQCKLWIPSLRNHEFIHFDGRGGQVSRGRTKKS